MGFYDVTLSYNCLFMADSEEEAKEKALNCYGNYNSPPFSSITVKERNKVKKTIHYTARNYYTQNVWVDKDMAEDDIIELWEKDEIQTSSEPKIDNTRVNDDISDIWVE